MSKIKWLFESIIRYYSYFKSFTGLGFYVLYLLGSNCKDNSIIQNVSLVTLLPDVDAVPNAQNRGLKKQKLDSNPSYLDTALHICNYTIKL